MVARLTSSQTSSEVLKSDIESAAATTTTTKTAQQRRNSDKQRGNKPGKPSLQERLHQRNGDSKKGLSDSLQHVEISFTACHGEKKNILPPKKTNELQKLAQET